MTGVRSIGIAAADRLRRIMACVSELLLASQNPGKLNEMRQLVEGLPFRVVGPRELGITDAPDETGTTFLENASLKARHYARLSGLLTVADDSGLSVDALGGEPGLYSSRFGGEGASDLARNLLLLEKLRDVPWDARGAHFTSAVVAVRAGSVLFSAQEDVIGRIAFEQRGTQGFGYDPLFFYPPFGRTFGESSPADKDRVSHRGKAFARLREFLAGLR
jgi:XTP/dITP diphosphohydrolase